VRNVGFNVVDAIRLTRKDQGRFESFHDFLRKVPIQVANKRTIESLVKAGAFDSLGATRRGMVEIHEAAVESAVKIKRDEEHGMVGFDFDSLFDDPQETEQVPDRPEWSKRRNSPSNATCSASTSPTTRWRGSKSRWPSTPAPPSST
jgi:DNA polymerase-3 subunit alpha